MMKLDAFVLLGEETNSKKTNTQIYMSRLIKCYLKFKHKNNMYAIKFFLCEIINMLNVFIQFYYINVCLGGRFLDYGAQLLNFYNNIEMGIDPMVEVFPKVTKCQFNRHGPGGDINVSIQNKMLNKQ